MTYCPEKIVHFWENQGKYVGWNKMSLKIIEYTINSIRKDRNTLTNFLSIVNAKRDHRLGMNFDQLVAQKLLKNGGKHRFEMQFSFKIVQINRSLLVNALFPLCSDHSIKKDSNDSEFRIRKSTCWPLNVIRHFVGSEMNQMKISVDTRNWIELNLRVCESQDS